MADAKPTTSMPAGDARREQLRINADSLAEEAVRKAEAEGVHAIDPAKLEVEREAAYEIVGGDGTEDRLAVHGAQPGYRYKRIRAFSSANPTEADPEQWAWHESRYRIRDRATGKVFCPWEIVNDKAGKDPEDRDCIKPSDPYGACRRRIDTILIRCREDWAQLCDQYDAAIRDEREGRSASYLVDKAQSAGVTATDISNSSPQAYMAMRRRGMDVSQINKALKEGTVAGLPPVGR